MSWGLGGWGLGGGHWVQGTGLVQTVFLLNGVINEGKEEMKEWRDEEMKETKGRKT